MLRRISRATVILVPLLTCVVRVQSRTVATPADIVKELARCVSLMRIGATRRNASTPRIAVVHGPAISGDPPR